MIRSVAFLTLVLLLGASSAFAADPPSTASATGAIATAVAFLDQTAIGNKFEIDSSALAQSKTKSQQVKAFADRMVADHTKAGNKFKEAVAQAKLPAPPDALDAKHAGLLKELENKRGTDFDKAYIETQTQAHVETVALFDAYAKGGDNARMKQFAQEMLPTLRDHLDHVRKLKAE